MKQASMVLMLLVAMMTATSCNNNSPNSDTPLIEIGKQREARQYFVNDFWKKRFSRCPDGWYKARIDTKNYYIPVFGPTTGWLAVKGEPQDWKIEPITPTEADKMKGLLWYGDITASASVSIAFNDKFRGGVWENYQDGWSAMPMASVASASKFMGDSQINQLRNEYKQIYLQIYNNEKVEGGWGVDVAVGRYENTDADLIRSWLLYGATPANCSEFPRLP